jgi:hypothetical protein
MSFSLGKENIRCVLRCQINESGIEAGSNNSPVPLRSLRPC